MLSLSVLGSIALRDYGANRKNLPRNDKKYMV